MSQTSSNGQGSTSASSKSQKEDDGLLPPQPLENQLVPEQQRTCGSEQQPTADTVVPDNHPRSSCHTENCAPWPPVNLWKICTAGNHESDLLESEETGPSCSGNEAQLNSSDSPEFTEVLITTVRGSAPTDCEWAEPKLSDSCQVQKETEDFEAWQTEALATVTVPTSSEHENTEAEKSPGEEHSVRHVDPPCLLAFKRESRQSPPLVEKIPEVRSQWDRRTYIPCDYCQRPSRPFIPWEPLEDDTNPELLFCCELAQKMREFLLGEEQAFREEELYKRIDVNPHPPFMSKQRKEATREQAQQRLEWKRWEPQRAQKADKLEIITISFDPSNEIYVTKAQGRLTQMDVKDTTGVFMVRKEKDSQHKEGVMVKAYPSGKPFVTLFPDKTGNLFYPSGNVAIVMSSLGAGDITYVILEDKDTKAKIKAIFTNKGWSTCYHPNALIWVNLTPVGGVLFSETGALRRRWNWHHLQRILPFQPLTLALGPHISVRIQAHDRMFLTFAHRQNHMRFSVGGSMLKFICPRSYERLGPDALTRHLQMKSLEIYSLLDQMQTCMANRSANPHNIKPRHGLAAQMERLRRQMGKERPPEKAPGNTT